MRLAWKFGVGDFCFFFKVNVAFEIFLFFIFFNLKTGDGMAVIYKTCVCCTRRREMWVYDLMDGFFIYFIFGLQADFLLLLLLLIELSTRILTRRPRL